MQIKKIASFDVKNGASTVRYADLDDGISFFPTDGIINIKSNKVRIAGFGVDANSLYRIKSSGEMYPLGDQNSVFLSNEGKETSASIGGSTGNNKWLLTISDDFGVTDGGTLYAKNANIAGTIHANTGTIGNWHISDGSLRTYGSDTCIQWVEGSSGGMLGTIEARNTTMANKSQVDGQDSRGIIISAYYGATVDIGIRGNENNSLDPGAWYSAIHVDGLSTVIRNPGGSISSYIQLKEGRITIDPNRFNDYTNNSKIIMHGPVYADDPLDGNNDLLLNGNNLSRANIYEDSVGPYVTLMFGDVDSVYGVRAWLSDAKYKNSILDTTVNATSIIRRLAFRQFNWNSNGQHTKIGLVAQELKKIDSDLVTEIRQPDGSLTDQINDVTMAMITAKATQETISRIDKLESSINSKIFQNKNELESKLMIENQKLKDRLDYLEARIKYISGEKSSYSEG